MSTSETNADFLRRLAQNDYTINGHYLMDGIGLNAVADDIERLERVIRQVADNIAGSPATIVEWSAQVGAAMRKLDELYQRMPPACQHEWERFGQLGPFEETNQCVKCQAIQPVEK